MTLTGREKYEKYQEAEKLIPNYWLDTCPECGNTEHINGCRCPDNHRYCKCGAQWRWIIDKNTFEPRVILEKKSLTK
jgi:hypothetical protein